MEEDENGLELSLVLGSGGSSVKSKGRSCSSSDARTEEVDRSNKLVDDLKNFLHSSKQDASNGHQRSDPPKPQENFFNGLSKANADADASINLNAGNKHKLFIDDISNQKKHERDAHHTDFHDKKASHVSITMEDVSTAENEDAAESEVEGSTSRLVSHHNDLSKRFVGVGDPTEVTKEAHGFSDSGAVNLQGQKRVNGSSENEFKRGNLNYRVPFSVQPVNVVNLPFSFPGKESNSDGAAISSGHPLKGMTQVIPAANGEQRTGTQSANPGNMPVMIRYSPVQLPTLDKDNSGGLVSHLQQFHPSPADRDPPNSAVQVVARNSSEATQYDGRMLERTKVDGKQHTPEEGSSSHTKDNAKGSSIIITAKVLTERSTVEGLALDFSSIKPGIASDMKFGGCGSYPNLPWVSTRAPGPNGRTISGVTYRYSTNQIRIVCACHGSHMSPEEFIRHASEDNGNPDNGNSLATFSSTNPAASAQS